MPFKPYLYLCWSISIITLADSFLREPQYRSGYFELAYKDHMLIEHQLDNLNVLDEFECNNACIMNDKCQSYNYGNTTDNNGLHVCELNERAAGSADASYLVEAPGYSYYQEPQTIKNTRCHLGTCQNGGTCQESNGFFVECKCSQYYTGRYCDDSHAKDCQAILAMGGTPSAKYPINPDGQGMIHVYCDQTTEGGGWILLQHRSTPFNTSFARDWKLYRNGFGDLNGEHWLGNEPIHRITTAGSKTLAIQLMTNNGDTATAYYTNFTVSNEDQRYRMDYNEHVATNADPGDALHDNKRMLFSTFDRDNDGNVHEDCAKIKDSAWWYTSSCGHSDLNQKDYPLWDKWWQFNSVSKSTMRVR